MFKTKHGEVSIKAARIVLLSKSLQILPCLLYTSGLRPEERRVFEAAQREIGDIYHRCLMGLARELTVPGIQIFEPESPWMKISKEECAELVEREIESIAETYREGLFQSGSVEDYRRRRITDICCLLYTSRCV